MKPFVLFFGEFSQPLDPLRHVVGEFDSVTDAQCAAESLELHARGNWAYVCLGHALAVVRAGMHQGTADHYSWDWDEGGLGS